MEPTLAEISAKLDTLIATVARLEAKMADAPTRTQYSIREFAPICGLTVVALKHYKAWKRYGGIKRGRRIVFPESARLALARGDRL